MGLDELALCLPNNAIQDFVSIYESDYPDPEERPSGKHFFIPSDYISLNTITEACRAEGKFIVRHDCEKDPSWLQLCGYGIFNAYGNIIHYTRNKSGTEERLHRFKSIGWGGHINNKDFGNDIANVKTNSLLKALWRETNEEVECKDTTLHYQGLLVVNESDDPVHLVHAGLVFELRGRFIRAKEEHNTEVTVTDPGSIRRESNNRSFELWSDVMLNCLTTSKHTFFE